jgi:F0F1-type ATP synthase assembly protein I
MGRSKPTSPWLNALASATQLTTDLIGLTGILGYLGYKGFERLAWSPELGLILGGGFGFGLAIYRILQRVRATEGENGPGDSPEGGSP